jgi:PPOX class probable F420-dependent enzyme
MARPSLAHRLTRRQDRLFDRLRDRSPLPAEATATSFDALAGARYALVVTYRRSGEPVPTPMWFGLDGDRVYARSLADAGKVKRLRGDPRVWIAPCTTRGRPTGPFAEAAGRILSADEREAAESALDRHYGRPRRLYEGFGTRLGVETVYLEITAAAPARARASAARDERGSR